MKKIFIILLLQVFIPSVDAVGQLPVFSSNVSDPDANQSLLFQKFHEKYNFIIGFTQRSFWYNRQHYSILAFDGNSWKLINWSYALREAERPKKQRLKTFEIHKEDAMDILNYLQKRNFFTLDQDSLNWNKKDKEDGSKLVMQIMDGKTDIFEIITRSGYRVSSAHEPEQLQDFTYIEQREIFIDCRNKFLELVNEKSR